MNEYTYEASFFNPPNSNYKGPENKRISNEKTIYTMLETYDREKLKTAYGPQERSK